MTVAHYGTWRSPLSAETVAAAALRLGSIVVEKDDLYWVEGRPQEGGRNVVVKRSANGRIADATPPGTNVRTRVQEYGGGAYTVSGGDLYYSEFADQRLYRLAPGGTSEPLTPPGDWFYADLTIDAARGRLLCVREDHTVSGREAVTTIVSVPLEERRDPQVLVSGHDFYSTPRVSPDGSRLSWLAWRHPQMPWDGTELWIADMAAGGQLTNPRLVVGGLTESIFQPGWSPDGVLYFVSDRTGWWNLYRWQEGGRDGQPAERIDAVCPMQAEFGLPQWQLGASTWAPVDRSHLISAYTERGRWRLAAIDLETGAVAPLAADLEPGDSVAATGTHAVFVGGSSFAPDAVVRVDLMTGEVDRVRQASDWQIEARFVSAPEAIEFPTDEGLTAHAFYYPPKNGDWTAPSGERPPLIVVSHGGPTSATTARLNLEIQYWTTRGFAVVDVNYGGSTGYGRAYRDRLKGRWGIVDVADCVRAALYLAGGLRVDRDRLIIRGRSAGGYTTLAALTFHPEVFKAGASYYGIADLESMTVGTHKFESRYLDSLVGPYPEARAIYRERSPIHFVDRLACALILFQGLEDRIVPPEQALTMAGAVRAKGLPLSLITFEGEQHGFRKAETIVRCLEAELAFYQQLFGLDRA